VSRKIKENEMKINSNI